MPLQRARKGDNVSYRAASGETFNVIVNAAQVTPPGQPASSTATTGGTLAAATYSYRITAVVDGIETGPSTAKTQATTGATSTVTVDWTAVANPSASAHKVYGRTGGSELLMGTVNMPTLTFVDTGSVTPSGALTVDDGKSTLQDPYGAPRTGVVKATAMKQTNRYYNRW